jgi:hypothetical protein
MEGGMEPVKIMPCPDMKGGGGVRGAGHRPTRRYSSPAMM